MPEATRRELTATGRVVCRGAADSEELGRFGHRDGGASGELIEAKVGVCGRETTLLFVVPSDDRAAHGCWALLPGDRRPPAPCITKAR
jgi:hypothetical protein